MRRMKKNSSSAVAAMTATALLSLTLAAQTNDPLRLSLQLVADGLVSPLSMIVLPDGRRMVADQVGVVRVLKSDGGLEDGVALDLSPRLSKVNHGSFDERGLLCMTLDPAFASNRHVFVSYTAPRRESAPADWDCTLRISRLTLPDVSPVRFDLASEKVVLEIDKPYFNHNGGRIAFGPDGFLYVTVGDGGGPQGCDLGNGHAPEGNGQNLGTLLAKILRIDVSNPGQDGYRVPADNPFVGVAGVRPEIWAYGVRNPWSISFDRAGDHNLFIGDVGQMRWEEVNIVRKGGNHGWPEREGLEGFDRQHPEKAAERIPAAGRRGEPFVDPVAVYKNVGAFKGQPDALGTSITGGYVYRGKAIPALAGHFVLGDWTGAWGAPQGRLMYARRPSDPAARWSIEPIRIDGPGKMFGTVCAFAEDREGELYVLTNGSTSLAGSRGKVWKLVPKASAARDAGTGN
jgi:glucose/arabinose dehydrogenase